jgi:hypothetical protein
LDDGVSAAKQSDQTKQRCCFEARLSHKSGAAAQLPNATQDEVF